MLSVSTTSALRRFASLSLRALLSLAAWALGLGVALAATLQWVRAPSFALFALGVGALEWFPWALLMAAVGALLAWMGTRKARPPGARWARTLARTALWLNLIGGVGLATASGLGLAQPPLVSTNIPALAAAPAGSFSLGRFLDDEAPTAVRAHRDVVYAQTADGALRMDVYRSVERPSDGRSAALIVVHGGSWRAGAKAEFEAASRAWAAEGYVVFDVDYRLAPEHPFPAAIRDVRCALGFIDAQADRFGIDPARKALVGRSAGGQIALVAAYAPPDALDPRCDVGPASVAAVVAFYAPTRMSYYDIIQPELSPGALDDYLGGSPEDVPAAYRKARPFTWVDASTPPTLLLHGRRDQFVRPVDALSLGKALAAAGRPYASVVLPRANHGFDANRAGLHSQRVQPYVDAFLQRFLDGDGQ